MYEPLKRALLEALRVPAEPSPPGGSAESLRVFRASRKWVRLRFVGWGIRQVFALLGILFILALPVSRIPFDVPPPMENAALWLGIEPTGAPDENGGPPRITWADLEGPLSLFEIAAIAFLVVQAFVSYAMIRMDWELRWYMTTDRSIRIREGTWSVREKTLTLTNVQNVQVEENPIQRLLGIADVKVRTAGGGDRSASDPQGHKKESELLHVAVFQHVEDAPGIRDLILHRLRRAKDAGLGDPEDPDEVERTAGPGEVSGEVLAAARDLLDAARELRRSL
jgi:hypothetical protein